MGLTFARFHAEIDRGLSRLRDARMEVATGALPSLLAGTWESWLYLAELLLSAAIPVGIVLAPRLRRSPPALTAAGLAAAAGLALNRLDVGIAGYWRDAGTTYFPSLLEWVLGFGVIAAAGYNTFHEVMALTDVPVLFSPSASGRRGE